MKLNPIAESRTAQAALEKYIKTGALPSIKAIKWLPPDGGAYTNGTTIYLPAPAAVTPDAFLLWRYKCEHELGHEHRRNASPHWKDVMETVRASGETNRTLDFIANLLSDFVQERNLFGEFDGRDHILGAGRAEFYRQHIFAHPDKRADSIEAQTLNGLFNIDAEMRATWNPRIDAALCRLVLAPAAAAHLDKVRAVGDWNACRNESDVWELAREIAKLYASDTAPPAEGEGEGEGEGAPKPAEGEGERKERHKPAEGEGAPKPAEGEGEGERKEGHKPAEGEGEGEGERKEGHKPSKAMDDASEKILVRADMHAAVMRTTHLSIGTYTMRKPNKFTF